MTSVSEDKSSEELPDSSAQIVQKTRNFRYTREFLLSLSELDICKKLPAGFDESVLSEFGVASGSSFEQQKNPGGSYFQNYKRNEYGTGPSNHSRGQGRWETRSSESSDREEAQADCELITQDSTKRYLNPSRRSWQQSEHDGLLGKPSGYSGHASAQKTGGISNYQLNKTTEVYQPPKPYKASSYSRNSTDSFNDETFGSSECSNQDMAEEEKRRRASFELMRREQHKTLNKKQKWVPDQHKENLSGDFVALSENSDNAQDVGKIHNEKSEDAFSVAQLGNASRSTLHSQASASRPLVPPGFGSTSMEKKPFPPSSNTSPPLKVGKLETSDECLPAKAETDANTNKQSGLNGKAGASPLVSQVPVCSSSDYLSYDPSGLLDASEGWEEVLVVDSVAQDAGKAEIVGMVDNCQPTSILDKLFQKAVTRNNGDLSDFIEHRDSKQDETRNPSQSLSSKFSHLFVEEDKKAGEDFSTGSLLSLIGSNGKVASQASPIVDEISMHSVHSDIPVKDNKISQTFFMTTSSLSEARHAEPHYTTEKQADFTGVLTCEDLEQSILAEAGVGGSRMEQPLSDSQRVVDDAVPEIQKPEVNKNASQHLLSLLQRDTDSKDSTPLGMFDAHPSHVEGTPDFSGGITSESSLTLETLFGSAFMKELQSAEAPVSAQRNSTASGSKTNPQHHDLPVSHPNASINSLFSSITGRHDPYASGREHWPDHEVSNSEGSKPVHLAGFADVTTDVHLPEEDNLMITLGDSRNERNAEIFPVEREAGHEKLLSLSRPDDIIGKVATLNPNLGGEGTSLHPGMDGPQPVRRLYDRNGLDPSLQQIFGATSSSPVHQIGHARPVFQQLDPRMHANPQMKFVGPDNIHHDPPHAFPPNMIHNHSFNNSGGLHIDPTPNLQMLQHMQMHGNLPPYQLHGYPRPMPPTHPFNRNPPCIHEVNQINSMHNFPVNHQQPAYGGGHGIGMPGPGIGRRLSNPDALQNMIDMELRANPKPKHPGMYGPEIDMAFRFR